MTGKQRENTPRRATRGAITRLLSAVDRLILAAQQAEAARRDLLAAQQQGKPRRATRGELAARVNALENAMAMVCRHVELTCGGNREMYRLSVVWQVANGALTREEGE